MRWGRSGGRDRVIAPSLAAGSGKAGGYRTALVFIRAEPAEETPNCSASCSFVGFINGPRAGMDPTHSRHRSCQISLQAPPANLRRFCQMKGRRSCHAPGFFFLPRRHTVQLAPDRRRTRCPAPFPSAVPALLVSLGRLTPQTHFKARARGTAHFL